MWKLILSYNNSILKYVIRVYIHNHMFIWMWYPYNNSIQFYVEKFVNFTFTKYIVPYIF